MRIVIQSTCTIKSECGRIVEQLAKDLEQIAPPLEGVELRELVGSSSVATYEFGPPPSAQFDPSSVKLAGLERFLKIAKGAAIERARVKFEADQKAQQDKYRETVHAQLAALVEAATKPTRSSTCHSLGSLATVLRDEPPPLGVAIIDGHFCRGENVVVEPGDDDHKIVFVFTASDAVQPGERLITSAAAKKRLQKLFPEAFLLNFLQLNALRIVIHGGNSESSVTVSATSPKPKRRTPVQATPEEQRVAGTEHPPTSIDPIDSGGALHGERLEHVEGDHGHAKGSNWCPAWIDLIKIRHFHQGEKLRIKVEGGATRVLVRLLPEPAQPDTDAGIDGDVVDASSGVIDVTLRSDHPRVKQISIHGCKEAWGQSLAEDNGPVERISVDQVSR